MANVVILNLTVFVCHIGTQECLVIFYTLAYKPASPQLCNSQYQLSPPALRTEPAAFGDTFIDPLMNIYMDSYKNGFS